MLKKETVFDYTPVLAILTTFLIKLVVIVLTNQNYHFDEIIVIWIGKLPMNELLQVVKSEPHPPGFYILTKLLPVENHVLTKNIINAVSSTLMIIFALILLKSNFMKKYKLQIGLTLFVLSASYLRITSYVKQDSISLPILLIGLSLCAMILTEKNVKRIIILITITNALLYILLATGYIPYLTLLVFTIFSLLIQKDKNKVKLLIISVLIQGIVLIPYLEYVGIYQLIKNTSRFPWIKHEGRYLLLDVRDFISYSYASNKLIEDIVTVTIIAFSVIYIARPKLKIFEKFVVIIFIMYIAAGYALKLFVRPRYLSIFFLSALIFTGWTIHQISLPKHIKTILLIAFILLYTSVSISGYTNSTAFNTAIQTNIAKDVEDINKNNKTGLLSKSSTFTFALKQNYISDQLIEPVNVLLPKYEYKNRIDATVIEMLRPFPEEITLDMISSNLKQTGYKQFIYIHGIGASYWDPNYYTLQALETGCQRDTSRISKIGYTVTLYKNCNFAHSGHKEL